MSAVTEVSRRAETGLEPETAELVGDGGLGLRELQADLGSAVDPAADRQDAGQGRLGRGEQCRQVEGAGGRVGRHRPSIAVGTCHFLSPSARTMAAQSKEVTA